MRDFAERLAACETSENQSAESNIPPAFHVCEKLRPLLATFMGNVGFRAIMSRALALANGEARGLRAVHVQANGSLAGVHLIEAQIGQKEMAEGGVILLAQLLGLLIVFIGEDLTMHMVHEAWPKLSLNELNFGKGDKNEKSK